jgi:hypothetical protein
VYRVRASMRVIGSNVLGVDTRGHGRNATALLRLCLARESANFGGQHRFHLSPTPPARPAATAHLAPCRRPVPGELSCPSIDGPIARNQHRNHPDIPSTMVQLIARPGRNAARQAKKAKEIAHVKGAIVWHEKQRLARKKMMKERYDEKSVGSMQKRWEHENITLKKRKALRNAAEDWKLGPLRPNRAVDVADGKYAVVQPGQIQRPEIPAWVHQRISERKEKKGLVPDYPLVVDDNKYFPMVKGDRVVVIRGKEKGKIGTVLTVVPRTHEFIVQGINMVRPPNNAHGVGYETD